MLDLFTPIVPEERLHPHFKRIISPGPSAWSTEKEVLNNWAKGFVDRDGKFVKEFQTTFNSSFWELYLFAVFKELDLEVDFSYSSPDFVFKAKKYSGVAEAVTSSNPENYRPEWDPNLEKDKNFEDFLRLSTIRLANSIDKKYKKYKEKYSKLSHVKEKPFILCVAPFEQPFFVDQRLSAIYRVLYSLGEAIILDPQEYSTNANRSCVQTQYPQVQKKPGVNIELGFFSKPMMPEISAVVFSTTATTSKVRALAKWSGKEFPLIQFAAIRHSSNTSQPQLIQATKENYKETLLDGLNIFLNPFATNPIDTSLFENREIAIHYYNPQINDYFTRVSDGFLLQRMCHVLATHQGSHNFDEEVPTSTNKYDELSKLHWPEGKLNYMGGEIPPYKDYFMAHWQGWTTLLALDCNDNKWIAQALKGLYLKLSEYLRAKNANKNEDSFLILQDLRNETKEEAMEAIKYQIDIYSIN